MLTAEVVQPTADVVSLTLAHSHFACAARLRWRISYSFLDFDRGCLGIRDYFVWKRLACF